MMMGIGAQHTLGRVLSQKISDSGLDIVLLIV